MRSKTKVAWRLRRYFSTLAVLQVLSLACLPLLVGAIAILLRHQTDDVFLPVWDYIFSFRIAFPPAIIFVLGYLLAFVTGVHLSETPKVVIRFFRNQYLQSSRFMLIGIGATSTFSAYILWFTSSYPPPQYERLVTTILRGESDDFLDARKAIAEAKGKNPALGEKFSLAMDAFVERARVNLQGGQVNTTRARLLVRALSDESDVDWTRHSFRKHALAESYSLLATAVKNSEAETSRPEVFGNLSSDALFKQSIELYSEVARTSSALTIPLMRVSALNNLGNVYYYLGDTTAALSAWQEANSDRLGYRNTSTWGNIIAALVILRRFDDAISEGEKAREWAERNGKALKETSQFVGIVTNTAFARLAKGHTEEALSDFQFANALQADADTLLNLALGYVLLNDPGKAQAVLRRVAPPVDRIGQAKAATSSTEIRCAQLLWFLADPQAPPPDKAARLYTFLGETWSPTELAKQSDADVLALRRKVAESLASFPGNCSSLAHFDIVRNAIGGNT